MSRLGLFLLRAWHRFTLGRTALPIFASHEPMPGTRQYLAKHLRATAYECTAMGVSIDVVYRKATDLGVGKVRIVIEVAP